MVLLVTRLKSTKYFFREIENLKNTMCFVKSGYYKIVQDSFISKEILNSFDLNRANFPVSIAKIRDPKKEYDLRVHFR